MTISQSKSLFYYLLIFISNQPIYVLRIFSRFLAKLVNLLKISKTSQTIRLNLNITFPELSKTEREKIIQKAIHNEMTSYFEFFNIWGASSEKNLSRISNIYGENLLIQALEKKQGLVVLLPHFGTWEILTTYISQFTELTIMYKPVKNQTADHFLRQARNREPANLVPTDENGVRQIFKALKNNGTTMILPDHSPRHPSTLIPYFGIPLSSSNLSSKLIQKTKAEALFLYAMRNKDGGFDIHIETINEAIYTSSADDGTAIIHQKLESIIQRYPAHYHWSYKRFKANPKLYDLYNIPPNEALNKIEESRYLKI